MAHLFIVNNITFKYHLEYGFAGTGASDVPTDFIFDAYVNLHTQNEKRSVGMISDVSRIRKGDKILFFVTKVAKFYGIFEADSEFFLDPNDEDNYLKNELGKILTYRIRIKPYKVFKNGISEYDCLDSLSGIEYPDQICWSLIYRKLGANRGCTMITDQEYEILEKKLSNNNELLTGNSFTFNQVNNCIESSTFAPNYNGRSLDIKRELLTNMVARQEDKKAFEHYLQYYTILLLKSPNYNKILTSNNPVTWIGNEVMCSFGEHRIDAYAIQKKENTVDISLIELKDEKINEYIIWQIDGYLKWLADYILPYYLRQGNSIKIHPIIISDGIENARNHTREKLKLVEDKVRDYDWSSYEQNNVTIANTKIIHISSIFDK